MCLVFGSLDPIYKTLPERTFAIFAYIVMVIIDGSVAGVLALEDIVESILGQEIFEHDDLAVDMRELAKRRHDLQNTKNNEPIGE